MKISKREFFDLWEGVKAQFFLDTNIKLKDKHYNRLAYEIIKVNGPTKGLTGSYLINKVKVFDEITTIVSIKNNIYESLWNYANRNASAEDKSQIADGTSKVSTTSKPFISRIDRIQSWIEETPVLAETTSSKKGLEQSVETNFFEEEKVEEVPKLSDLVGTDLEAQNNTLNIEQHEETVSYLAKPLEELPEIENEPIALNEATNSSQLIVPIPSIEEARIIIDTSTVLIPDTKLIEPKASKFQSKLLVLVSSIGIIFFLIMGYHLFSEEDTNKNQEVPTYLTTVSTPESTIKTFFNFINQKDYKQAFALTDNELWNPYTKFIKSDVWGGYEELSQPAMLKKDYTSKYGADEILEVSFYAFDIAKQENLFLKYDFHLVKREGGFIIVRMVYPK